MRANLIHHQIIMTNNEWREIPSFSGYIINSDGEVIRKAATVLRNGKITNIKQRKLKENRSDKGYVTVNLRNGDCTKKMYVHRLVYSAFHPEEDISHMEIDHKDTDRQNNNLSNLRAVTSKENKNNPRTKKNTRVPTHWTRASLRGLQRGESVTLRLSSKMCFNALTRLPDALNQAVITSR